MPFNPEKEEDFLTNEYFVQWALHPNKESDRFWTSWMAKNPNKILLLKRAKEILQSFKPVEHQMDEAAHEKILDNILLYNQQVTRKTTNFIRIENFRVPSVAAVWLMILGLTAGFLYWLLPHPDDTVVIPHQEWVSKSTSSGAKLTFKLPDGSLVRLNANSSITYPKIFSDSLREVSVEGQVFFEVEKQPSAPFLVQAGGLNIQVLGTSFDVRSYPGEAYQTVALVSGAVSISNSEGINERLQPFEMISYAKEEHEMTKAPFDPDNLLGWITGVIYFDNTPFTEVFKTLEQWYGVEISIRPGLSFSERYTGRYKNQNLEDVLTGIAFSEGFQFTIEGKHVEIF